MLPQKKAKEDANKTNKKWTGRFGRRHSRRNSDQEVGCESGNGNGGSASAQIATEESATVESHGPLQSRPDVNDHAKMQAPTWEDACNNSSSYAHPLQLLDNQSIDDDIGDVGPKSSTSSNKAVFAYGRSSSNISSSTSTSIKKSSTEHSLSQWLQLITISVLFSTLQYL